MELLNADEVKTLFLTRMLTPKVRYKLGDAAALAELLPELDWMDTPPEEPIRPMPYGALKRWMHTFRACRSATICKLKITTKAICKTHNLEALEALMPLLYPGWDGNECMRPSTFWCCGGSWG